MPISEERHVERETPEPRFYLENFRNAGRCPTRLVLWTTQASEEVLDTRFMKSYHNLCLYSGHLSSLEKWVSEEGLLFLFPQRGVGSFLAGSVAQPLKAGDVLFQSGAAGITFSAAARCEMDFSYFVVNPEQLAFIFAGQEIGFLQKLLDFTKRFRLIPASSAFAAECHQLLDHTPPRFNLAHRSHLLSVAGAILSDEFENAPPEQHGFMGTAERLTQKLRGMSVEEILSLSGEELATRFSCSRRHLNRLFNDYFGFPVGVLRMEMRLVKAASLLRNSDAKVINIAEQSGFNHLGLFNSCFKRRFGASPTRWRKAQAANSNDAASPALQDSDSSDARQTIVPVAAQTGASKNSQIKAGNAAEAVAVLVRNGLVPGTPASRPPRKSTAECTNARLARQRRIRDLASTTASLVSI